MQTVRQYWEERARQNVDVAAATTDDIHLRDLEVAALAATLREIGVRPGTTVLDLGCGDGFSTLGVAAALPRVAFLGIDYAPGMVENARRRLASRPELQDRVRFQEGNALDLDGACGQSLFDIVITDRCLINLPDAESQREAIRQIAAHTLLGGHYVAIENFEETQANLNQARAGIGLPEIPIRWHNMYFREADFREGADPYFDRIDFRDFASSYYFATRLVYSKLCQIRGEKPDYDHDIHRLAVNLPSFGQVSPVRMVLLHRREAGRRET